jgi:hypothetical protein
MSSAGLSNVPIDPLAGIDPTTPQDVQREIVSKIVLGDGMSVVDANALLSAKGFQPLNVNSVDYAQARKTALINDSAFIRAYGDADPDAIAALYQADLRISQARGNLTDRPTSPNDPTFDGLRRTVAESLPSDSKVENVVEYSGDLATLASSIGLYGEGANTLAADHFQAIRDTAALTPEELAAYGERETATLHAAIGEGADQKLKDASKVLSDKSGRKLDLSAIVKSNGARVAVNLYFAALNIAAAKK